jgi:hypothetical protein
MRALSPRTLLALWEDGRGRGKTDQALILLCSAVPEMSPVQLKNICMGQRDVLLLALRELTFGAKIAGLFSCLACRERVELLFNTSDLQINTKLNQSEAFVLNVDGYEISFRLPNSADSSFIRRDQEMADAKRQLLNRCILSVSQSGETRKKETLPDAVMDQIVDRMNKEDPEGNIKIGFVCPACSVHGEAVFDPASFFLSEIEAWALRILREVHLLASAYGWSEADILSMSGWRRQRYLEMVSV